MNKFNRTFIGVDTSGCPYDFAACVVMKRTDEHMCIVIENFQMPMKTREDSIVFESRVSELEKKYNAKVISKPKSRVLSNKSSYLESMSQYLSNREISFKR